MFRAIKNIKSLVSPKLTRSSSVTPIRDSRIVMLQSSLCDRQKTSHCSCCFASLGQQRNLFTEAALGIDKLDRIQEKKRQLFPGPSKERYLQRLSSFTQEANGECIIKDDLINLIGLAENDEHLDLLEKIIQITSDKEMIVKDGWGVALMRLYYRMGKLDRALGSLRDYERYGNFFNQLTCYKILMNMLFNACRYDEALEVYEMFKKRLPYDQTEPNNPCYDLITLAFASLAKMNNKEALNRAQQLYSNLAKNRRPGLRPSSFLAYLAVNNNEPAFALNLISSINGSGYVSLRELKIISLLKLERYEDILLQLREFLQTIRRDATILLKSTFETVENSVDKIKDENIRQEMKDFLVEFKAGGHISDATIEELLFKPIKNLRPFGRQSNQPDRYDQTSQNSRYQGQYRMRRNYYEDSNQRAYGLDNSEAGEFRQRPRSYNAQRYRDSDDYSQRGGNSGRDEERKKFTYQNMNFD